MIELIKAIFLGVVEGITEWLPISSTGHMLLVDRFLQLKQSAAFKEVFFVVIQLGAIMAVVVLYWKRMVPAAWSETGKLSVKWDVVRLWMKAAVACIPGAVVTLLFDDWMEQHLHTPVVIAATLILYGVWFLVVERRKKRKVRIESLEQITYPVALGIGLFQVLAIVPGTSRSGATILGALLLGVSRVAAADFVFFLAVPVMFGWSLVKLVKIGFLFTTPEIFILLAGTVTAYLVSLVVIRYFLKYIKNHDFRVFGWYRIVLGILVLLVTIIF
ncbi:MAG: undecaprenyl-diphosphate phosphatase [Roseburia sp.]